MNTTFVSPGLLTAETIGPAASGSSCQAFPTTMNTDCEPEQVPTTPFFKLLLLGILLQE